MRLSVFLVIFTLAPGATLEVTPQRIPQGSTLRVESPVEAASARLNGRVIPLFRQKDGAWFGLMPVPVGEKPGQYELDLLDKNGGAVNKAAITVVDAHFPSQNIVISKALSELKATSDEVDRVAAFRKEVLDDRFWTDPLHAPVPGCMTSPFGVRRLHNGKPTGDFHGGLDLRAREGFPIRAAAPGIVKIASQMQLHGGTVAIDHGQGLQSMYLHMSHVAAKEGSTVQTGEIIGYAGSTGRSTASHLHWTLYVNGVPVNPLQWVKIAPCASAQRPAKKSGRHR